MNFFSLCFFKSHFALPFGDSASCKNKRSGPPEGKRKNDQAKRDISSTELHALRRFHPWPINVVVYHDPSGRIHLGRGLALRCFQRLSFPNIATQQCRYTENWKTSGSPD